MAKRKWTRAELQYELDRRRRFPPSTVNKDGFIVMQPVTVAQLREELKKLPANSEDRDWRELELALAREHYRTTASAPFLRVVE